MFCGQDTFFIHIYVHKQPQIQSSQNYKPPTVSISQLIFLSLQRIFRIVCAKIQKYLIFAVSGKKKRYR